MADVVAVLVVGVSIGVGVDSEMVRIIYAPQPPPPSSGWCSWFESVGVGSVLCIVGAVKVVISVAAGMVGIEAAEEVLFTIQTSFNFSIAPIAPSHNAWHYLSSGFSALLGRTNSLTRLRCSHPINSEMLLP